MVREDILGGLKNALERGDSLEKAKGSFISAGYPKNEVEEAAASLEKVQIKKKEIPTLFTANLEPAAPSTMADNLGPTSEKKVISPGSRIIKPLPQIKVKRKVHYWMIPLIIAISVAIAYLVYSLLLAQ